MTDTLSSSSSADSVVIRRAVLSDAAVLSRLGESTFVETFGHLYQADDLAAYLLEAYNVPRIEGDIADERKAMWIVERGGEPIGYCLCGPCGLPHADVTPDCLELKRFYLTQACTGQGIGTKLLAVVDAWLKAESLARTRAGKSHHVWVSVWSLNHGAQRFYQRVGFQFFEQYHFMVGKHADEEFMFRRPAQESEATLTQT